MPQPFAADDFASIRKRMSEISLTCEMCETTIGVSRAHRTTAYNYDGTPGDKDDPNYANLCAGCWKIELDHWREMWSEYYHGRL